MATNDPFALGLTPNLPFLDDLYEQYRRDPASVDPSFVALLKGNWGLPSEQNGQAQNGSGNGKGQNGSGYGAQSGPLHGYGGQNGAGGAGSHGEGDGAGGGSVSAHGSNGGARGAGPGSGAAARMPEWVTAATMAEISSGVRLDKVQALVSAYRTRGHFAAKLDPLDHLPRDPRPELDPSTYGFTEEELDQVVPTDLYGAAEAPLREIIRRLQRTYCGSIGVELMHISDQAKRAWLAQRLEPTENQPQIDAATRLHALEYVAAADTFERFCANKYPGAKRFGLDGSEALIPLIDLCLERAGLHGVEEVVIGMPHRGRLNVLANVMRKNAGDIFAEFQDIDGGSVLGGGDVKYHMGFSSDHTTRAGSRIHLSLAFNPSHLEAVDPVVLGRVRAKQRRFGDNEKRKVLGILMHGDAAFAGQGLVSECLNLADLRGYRTGGTVHVIVNNQIGFTTSPSEGRSTPYCTDVAKMIQCPIFHVNGDDVDAVAHVVRLAMDYRREFQQDVVIDMFCFRRFGHNEMDEPSFTQPLMYSKIKLHTPLPEIYSQKLIGEGLLTEEQFQQMVAARKAVYEAEWEKARQATKRPKQEAFGGVWTRFVGGPDAAVAEADTTVPRVRLQEIAARLVALPPGFHPHKNIVNLWERRSRMGLGELPLDWGMAEALAFGSLLWDGNVVRVSGQDCRRGTFSHRHAVIVDIETGAEHKPLGDLHATQGVFSIFDSPLSEAAVLGFEYGYSLDFPDGLVIWEAQFGDFVNGAQVILDQFISSSEDKWNRTSGVVLFLPHGFEGQGPEHSSARFERFLQLCAEDNIQVCYPSTPAQFFHMLRRQVLRKWRKPLIVMTPKSLLRLPAAGSSLEELSGGKFHRVLDEEASDRDRGAVRKVMLCTGKVYYDLAEERSKRAARDVAIVRLEQLYPLKAEQITEVLDRYPHVDDVVWVQEEPANMGARRYVRGRLHAAVGSRPLRFVSRVESASPATGSHSAHVMETRRLLDEAFGR